MGQISVEEKDRRIRRMAEAVAQHRSGAKQDFTVTEADRMLVAQLVRVWTGTPVGIVAPRSRFLR